MAKEWAKKRGGSTSWGKVDEWYNDLVGSEGMYYHKAIILPKLLELFDFASSPSPSLLDIGCGQGVLSRALPETVDYCGIDLSKELIAHAKRLNRRTGCSFYAGDAAKKLPIEKSDFTHAALLLALQNMEEPLIALKNAASHMRAGGRLFLVLNHPCFRIPRQSHWGVDEERRLQYRRLDRYMSPLKIPIQAKPSRREESATTLSFHHPLSSYFLWLKEAGFMVSALDEWCSDKVSTGSRAKMENRARSEFPLFLFIEAVKKNIDK